MANVRLVCDWCDQCDWCGNCFPDLLLDETGHLEPPVLVVWGWQPLEPLESAVLAMGGWQPPVKNTARPVWNTAGQPHPTQSSAVPSRAYQICAVHPTIIRLTMAQVPHESVCLSVCLFVCPFVHFSTFALVCMWHYMYEHYRYANTAAPMPFKFMYIILCMYPKAK